MPLDVRWPFPDFNKPHRLWKLGSSIVVPTVGILSKIMSDWLNTFTVYNRDALIEALEKRPPDQPLVTVCNHHSCLDDPVLWAGILDWRHVLNSRIMRWSAAAHDICFTQELHSMFFSLGKTFPICRGEGVYQRAMDFCIQLMNTGAWVHIFPEGKVNMVTKEFLRLKWGVGRLISECKVTPIVIPFWHVGMDSILPNKEPYVPQIGKKVTVLIGRPMDFQPVRARLEEENRTPIEKRKEITDLIQQEFWYLKQEAERLHYGNTDRTISS